MKRLIIILIILIGGSGCISGFQDDVNKVTQALALTLRTFISFFQENLGDCEAFLSIYDGISEEPETCDNGDEGSFQLTKLSVECIDGPPLTATANFILSQNNCQDDGTEITATGDMNMTLSFSAAGNIGTLSSQDFLAQGLTFVFGNFETKVEFANNNLSCDDSDDLLVDGDDCEVSGDCQDCNF
ncbi:MAG: hypothetical protein R3257_00820 [bacterium]|nr:hypothetical protein [bacterium]